MSKKRNVVFRVDASPSIGGGHVMRCLAMASVMKNEGWEPHFVGIPETYGMVKALERSGFNWSPIPEPNDARALKKAIEKCDLLVIDNYSLDVNYEKACRGWADKIMVIDDLANRHHECDLLLDQTYGRTANDYRHLTPPHCRILTGPDYALLRPEFAINRKNRQSQKPVNRVLMSFGMADTSQVLPKIIPMVRQVIPKAELDVVIGSNALHIEQLHSLASQDDNLTLHIDSSDMPALMQNTDVALIAAGTTVWEICCLAVPAILLIVADNQRDIASAIRHAGIAPVAETIDELEKSFRNLLGNNEERRAVARQLGSLCDGRGSLRIAQEFSPECANGEPIQLRRMTRDDADILLKWQSNPVTREFSRNPAPPSKEEHYCWFENKLMDPDSLFNIIIRDGQATGMVRLDRRPIGSPDSFEVSILIAPEHHGQGIGTAALRAIRRLAPEVKIYAEVHSKNRASHALFNAAGYRLEDDWYVSEPIKEN